MHLTTFKTPILFLIFNRPDTTQKVFDEIKKIKPKYLYVAADGPRKNKPGETELCRVTREIIKQVDWPCEIKTRFLDYNLGCGRAVSSSISWFFDSVEKGIILEDDCVPNGSFFHFCEKLLDKYEKDEKVMHIGGTNMRPEIGIRESYCFSDIPNIWGWASWRRAWKLYQFHFGSTEDIITVVDNHFRKKSLQSYWKNVFLQTHRRKIDTWDYQWVFACWKNNGLSISPKVNLISNIGFNNNSSRFFLHDSVRDTTKTNEISFPLIHPTITCNEERDNFLYKNVYLHSWQRIFRLLRENNFSHLIQYSLKKINR